ncbi:MAG: HAD family hydrolase [Clostridia bacterium]|nr:HAD family hydrolase [Clostridia bacterium]
MAKYLFFDLDGTLTDPFEGITSAILYALGKMGMEKPERSFLGKFIGPPLTGSFREYLGMTGEEADRALSLYREYYRDRGLFENALYPGIPEALAKLKSAGKTVCLATSKPEPFARRILEHFSVDGYFDEICGATLDGTRETKAAVLKELTARLAVDPASPNAMMIGDRRHDAEGAREIGIPTVGVLWGYGSREELEAAGCVRIAETPEELASILL